MRSISFAAALIVLIVAPSFAQEWTDYINRGDFFAVNLPGEPKVKDITWQGEYIVKNPFREYTADAGKDHYSVTVVDYTDALKKHQEQVKICKAAGGDGDHARNAHQQICARRCSCELGNNRKGSGCKANPPGLYAGRPCRRG